MQNQRRGPECHVPLTQEEAAFAAELFKSLGHPLRLRIISELSRSPVHVSELAARLGVAQPVVSQQLRILRSAQLVSSETVGGKAVYRILEPHLYELLGCLRRCLSSRQERGFLR